LRIAGCYLSWRGVSHHVGGHPPSFIAYLVCYLPKPRICWSSKTGQLTTEDLHPIRFAALSAVPITDRSSAAARLKRQMKLEKTPPNAKPAKRTLDKAVSCSNLLLECNCLYGRQPCRAVAMGRGKCYPVLDERRERTRGRSVQASRRRPRQDRQTRRMGFGSLARRRPHPPGWALTLQVCHSIINFDKSKALWDQRSGSPKSTQI